MSKTEAAKRLYEECKDMDIDETMELVLSAETGLCDLAALYDNTNEFRRFAIYKSGESVRMSKNISEWYIKWQKECQ